MKSKAKGISFSLIILASIFLVSVVFAENIKISRIENRLQSNGIDFEIEVLEDNKKIYPNKDVTYAVTVKNKGISSYVRFVLDMDLLSDSDFYGLNENLIKKGKYYYYTKPVKSKECIKLFDGFTVPKDITNAGKELIVRGRYEAIQSENFYPSFDSENPWGDVVVTESTFDGDNYIAKAREVIPIKIDVARATDISSDEILNSEIISGDTITNTIILKNNSDIDKKVSFESLLNGDSRLFSEMEMTLKEENKILYSGKLSEAIFKKDIGNIKANESKLLSYEIAMSKEADNLLSGKNDTLVWHVASSDTKQVKTGDTFSINALLIALLASVIIGGIVYVVGGKNEK